MTTPMDVTDNAPGSAAADATARALVENKDRLGLTWDLRPATVLSIDGSTGKVGVMVDGDSTSLAATSMVGNLFNGDRVYLILLPTGGIFIVGFVGPANTSGDPIGTAYFSASSGAGSTGAETALTFGASTSFIINTNKIVRLSLSCGILTNSAAVTAQQIRVRSVAGSTTATVLLSAQYLIAAGSNGFAFTTTSWSYIKNIGGPIAFDPGVTNQRTLGAGTSSLFGDATAPITLAGIEVGDIRDPALEAISLIATQVA